jgi:glycosyltransferase involved in cell wall biosynthesis
MKRYLPNSIKYPLWWLLKSPQRALGFGTVIRDIKGLFYILLSYNPIKSKPKPISICVGIKDRSQQFISHFLPSLNSCLYLSMVELSVFDCGSTDVPNLQQEIQSVFKGKLIFRSEPKPFERSHSFNQAIRQSTHDIIFVCDADFSLPPNLVQACNDFTRFNSFWFPIVFYLYKNRKPLYGKRNGEWMLWGGKGIFASNRKDFEAVGGLDETYKTWGGEDEEFWLRCHSKQYCILRSREPQLLHHWHPSLNPKYKKIEELTDLGIL